MGFLAGADYEMSREEHQGLSNLWNVMDASDTNQVLKCECKDKTALAMACEAGNVAEPFPRCPWAIDLSDKPFPGREKFKGQWGGRTRSTISAAGFGKAGLTRIPSPDVEQIRDLNLRAMYGAWDALKNVDQALSQSSHRLGRVHRRQTRVAPVAGRCDSRPRMISHQPRLRRRRFPCSWHIDVHTPDTAFQKGLEGEEFISRATEGKGYQYQGPYWAPYRCLYSRNVTNLFMAGRDISVTHEALGPVRVMRTCGMMGEIVGKAAWICVRHETTPRGVYEKLSAAAQGTHVPAGSDAANRVGRPIGVAGQTGVTKQYHITGINHSVTDWPQFSKSPTGLLDHATSETAGGRKLGIDATMKIPGEGFKRAWPRHQDGCGGEGEN